MLYVLLNKAGVRQDGNIKATQTNMEESEGDTDQVLPQRGATSVVETQTWVLFRSPRLKVAPNSSNTYTGIESNITTAQKQPK